MEDELAKQSVPVSHRLSVRPGAVCPRESPDANLGRRSVMPILEVTRSFQSSLRTLEEAVEMS